MALLSRRKSAPSKGFPNYAALDMSGIVGLTEDRTKKLESIYHAAQKRAWDGREVLQKCIEQNGGIQLSREKREAVASVFSIILWGELAAWIVSADLAERIEDIEAKMAATSQTLDEARHFCVMRDYLRELGVPIPPLDPYSRLILREVLDAESVLFKLVGMQLLVENAALAIFKMVGNARVEPVLSDLMPYFERDEARHVGLGVNYLPALMANLSTYEVTKLNIYQARLYTLLFWATMLLKKDFDVLGLDSNESTRFSLRLQVDIATQIGKFSTQERARKTGRAVYVEPELLRKTHSFSIDAFQPRPGAHVPGWQRSVLNMAQTVARLGARALDVADPA